MSEPVGVEIEMMGRTRHLLFTLNEIIDLMAALNVKTMAEFDTALPNAIATDPLMLRKTVWCGLRIEDTELTEEAASGLVDVRYMGDLYAKLTLALQAARSGKPANGSPAPPKAIGARK